MKTKSGSQFDPLTFDVATFDSILAKGLSHGLGERGGQVCIEAAICQVMGFDHGDDPGCVAPTVRIFKIRLNDSRWSSPTARAKGLRDLGLAQLGSLGTIDEGEFVKRLAERTIRVFIPMLFRDLFPDNKELMAAAERCEKEGTREAAREAQKAAASKYAAADAAYDAAAYDAAAYAAAADAYDAAAYAAYAAAAAADAAAAAAAAYAAAPKGDKYLELSAKLALDILRELQSPGVQLLQ
jgi:hypothetical protein